MARFGARTTLFTVVSVAVVAVAFKTFLSWKSRRGNLDEGTEAQDEANIGDAQRAQALQISFDDAIAASKNLRGLTNGDKLMLYGLYKQATIGDASSVGASFLNLIEYSKHSIWSKFRGMAPSTAMIHYIEAVKGLQNGESSSENSSDKVNMVEQPSTMGLQPSMPLDLPDEMEVNGDTLEAKLRNAAASGNLGQMKQVIEEGADVNSADDHGETALHFCADRGLINGVRYLLELGANANASDHDGISVLQAAVIAGHIEVCKALLDAGADPDHQDADGDSPRSCASEDSSESMIELFSPKDKQ